MKIMAKQFKLLIEKPVLQEKVYRLLLLLSSILVIGCVGMYCLSPAIDSDMVEGLFWAEAAMSRKGLLDTDFIYSYAMPFGSNLLLIPFVHLFGMSQLANSLGMLLFYFLMSVVCCMFLKSLDIDKNNALVGTAVVMLAFRTQMGVNLLHHILFYQLGIICFMGIMCSLLNIIKNRETSAHKKWFLLLILFSIWSGSNGTPSMMLSAFPVLSALFVVLLQGKIHKKTAFKIGGSVFVGVLAGYGVYFSALQGIHESTYLKNTGSFTFASTNLWTEHLEEFPKIWLDLFIVTNPEQELIASFTGLETIISIMISIVIAVIPLFFCWRIRKPETADKMLLLGCFVIWAVCLFQYFFVRRKAEDRLLYNGIFANFILLAVLVCKYKPRTIKQRFTVLTIAGILSLYSIFFSVNANWSYTSLYIEKLEERGLAYGVASSFWDAGINTVNSEGRVKIRPVTVSNGSIKPFEYQTKNSWYQDPPEGKYWFLLLHDKDYNQLLNAPNKLLIENCNDVISLMGNYADPNESARHAYNDFVENQQYKALVFPVDKWDECIYGKRVSYNFESNAWSSVCEYIDGARHIHEGGISYGPYMKVKEGESCKVFIEGKNLNHAQIQVYSMQNDETIYLEPEFSWHEDDQMEFIIRAPIDLDALEVVIRNPSVDNKQDDIQLYTETVGIISSELF